MTDPQPTASSHSTASAKPRFRALIVDFGGVLTTPLQDAFAAFAADAGIDFEHLLRAALASYTGGVDDLVVGFETGRVPEDEFSVAFARRLSELSGREVPPEGIVKRMFAAMRMEDEMLAAIRAAREGGLKTGLLSNSWGTDDYPRELLDPLFDVIVLSGEVGLRKPDPRIFSLTVERLGVAPDECVFVDDHPGHLKAAQEAGMTTVLHRDPRTTITELERLLFLSLSTQT